MTETTQPIDPRSTPQFEAGTVEYAVIALLRSIGARLREGGPAAVIDQLTDANMTQWAKEVAAGGQPAVVVTPGSAASVDKRGGDFAGIPEANRRHPVNAKDTQAPVINDKE